MSNRLYVAAAAAALVVGAAALSQMSPPAGASTLTTGQRAIEGNVQVTAVSLSHSPGGPGAGSAAAVS